VPPIVCDGTNPLLAYDCIEESRSHAGIAAIGRVVILWRGCREFAISIAVVGTARGSLGGGKDVAAVVCDAARNASVARGAEPTRNAWNVVVLVANGSVGDHTVFSCFETLTTVCGVLDGSTSRGAQLTDKSSQTGLTGIRLQVARMRNNFRHQISACTVVHHVRLHQEKGLRSNKLELHHGGSSLFTSKLLKTK